jgi:hypothetical protein
VIAKWPSENCMSKSVGWLVRLPLLGRYKCAKVDECSLSKKTLCLLVKSLFQVSYVFGAKAKMICPPNSYLYLPKAYISSQYRLLSFVSFNHY